MEKEISYILALMVVFLSLTRNDLSEVVNITSIFLIFYSAFKSLLESLFNKN